MLKAGDSAPPFTLKDQNGRTYKLSDYQGKWLVLFLYPKANTPGCTVEACSFRDHTDAIRELGVEILGLSKDTITAQAKFADRYNLPYSLLADPETTTIQKYGAWGTKKMFGREVHGTKRTTFIINPKNKIAKIYDSVKPNTHTQEVLKDLKSLINN